MVGQAAGNMANCSEVCQLLPRGHGPKRRGVWLEGRQGQSTGLLGHVEELGVILRAVGRH